MRILIVRPGAIGDTLLALPVIHALRSHFSNPRVTFVGNAAVLPLILVSGLAEECSDYEDARWSALFSTTGKLAAILTEYDLAICWLRDPDGIVAHNLRAAGVREAIVAPGRPPEGQRVHIVDYLIETVNRILSPPALMPDPRFTIHLPPIDAPAHRRYDIAIHPGSGGARKCWPITSFVSLIQRLHEDGRRILLLSGPADHARVAEISKLASDAPATLVDAPLLEVARSIKQCCCYLGNDSGITHLAAMLGTPTIALFGASDPAVWHPVGPGIEVIHAPRWEEITVDQVVKSLELHLT